jgi:hypothetical protein
MVKKNQIRERAKKKKAAGEQEQDENELVIETALDYEEKCLIELKKLQFAERKLSADFDRIQKEGNQQGNKENMKTLFQNVDYILDKKLILLINDPVTSTWQLPYAEWTGADSSLRQVRKSILKYI